MSEEIEMVPESTAFAWGIVAFLVGLVVGFVLVAASIFGSCK